MDQSLEEQVKHVIKLLRAKQEPLPRDSPAFAKALEWIRIAPGKVDGALRQDLIASVCHAFAISELEVVESLAGVEIKPNAKLGSQNGHRVNEEGMLEAIFPKEGWFADYIEYTRYNEAPMSYHVMVSFAVLGAALGRRCYIDMGHHKIFAPLNVMLIGPTGVVHKSTAVNIARELVRLACVCPISADKITAESLVTDLMEHPQQFIPAAELSVFFGRQKYLEGLSTLILRLLDYPSEFAARTLARSLETIPEPTISIIGGSTMSLLTDSTPAEIISNGFLNRFVVVVENYSMRVFPKPRKGPGEESLLKLLKWLKSYKGEITLCEGTKAYDFYDVWYRQRKKRNDSDPAVAEVTQRGSDHLLRLAMLCHVTLCGTLTLCVDCMSMAAKMLAFLERKAPDLVRAVHASTQTSNSDYVIGVLQKLGGGADHSTLLRRVSSRMNALQFKQVIQTLNEAGILRASTKGVGQFYILKEEDETTSGHI